MRESRGAPPPLGVPNWPDSPVVGLAEQGALRLRRGEVVGDGSGRFRRARLEYLTEGAQVAVSITTGRLTVGQPDGPMRLRLAAELRAEELRGLLALHLASGEAAEFEAEAVLEDRRMHMVGRRRPEWTVAISSAPVTGDLHFAVIRSGEAMGISAEFRLLGPNELPDPPSVT